MSSMQISSPKLNGLNGGMFLNGRKPKILVIGGGSGASNLLVHLKEFPIDLKVIVTMFDSGGSTGLLRDEFGYPSFGDLRQCLLALSNDGNDTQPLKEALSFRFGSETSLNGHSVGNLMLAALTSLRNGLEAALVDIGRVLQVSGEVIPVTLERSELCAELENGEIIHGESNIDLRQNPLPRIKKVFLNNSVKANPKAIQAVKDADAIIIGPGDLYTSIIPNLLADGMNEAIAGSAATRVYVSNLMTKVGETDDFKSSDFVNELVSHLGNGNLDWAVINTAQPPIDVLQAYKQQGAKVVHTDLDAIDMARGIVTGPIATNNLPWRHDSVKTIEAVMQALNVGRGESPQHIKFEPTIFA